MASGGYSRCARTPIAGCRRRRHAHAVRRFPTQYGAFRMRRVVVTGLGMVTPLGCGVESTWQRLINAESGARKVDTFEVSDLAARIACMIPRGDGSRGTYNPNDWMEPKE